MCESTETAWKLAGSYTALFICKCACLMATLDDVKTEWDDKAQAWNAWVGEEGDENRRKASDPVLWRFIGDKVEGATVLDAGCGTGCVRVNRKMCENMKHVCFRPSAAKYNTNLSSYTTRLFRRFHSFYPNSYLSIKLARQGEQKK